MKQYNALLGEKINLEKVQELIQIAKENEQHQLAMYLSNVLEVIKDKGYNFVEIAKPFVEQLPNSLLPGLESLPAYIDIENIQSLNAAVTPDEIYQYITNLIIETIKEVGHLPWQRSWEKTSFSKGKQAINFESKKPYRGINYFLLNFEVKVKDNKSYLVRRKLENPYFLTFNQIKKHKGKLEKGSKGNRVVYFIEMYHHKEILKSGKLLEFSTYNKKKFIEWILKNKSNLKRFKGMNKEEIEQSSLPIIPILKYYNVFNGSDITGIDWGDFPVNENASKPVKEKIEVAESIIRNIPKPPTLEFGGNQPAYYSGTDSILMTEIDKFRSEQEYYSTLFHEFAHSTGHKKRLGRSTVYGGKTITQTDRAKEELVAEMGAVFLCAESGILFSVIDNSAKYLSGWNKRLVKHMEEDNRFYFRAASAAQAAADYILDRDEKGIPAYLKDLEKQVKEKKTSKPTKTFKYPKHFQPVVDYWVKKDKELEKVTNLKNGDIRFKFKGDKYSRTVRFKNGIIEEKLPTIGWSKMYNPKKTVKAENKIKREVVNIETSWHKATDRIAITSNQIKYIQDLATEQTLPEWPFSSTTNAMRSLTKIDAQEIIEALKDGNIVVFDEEDEPKEPKKKTNEKAESTVKSFKMSDIFVDEKRFQNRSKLNENMVSNIVKNYKETDFDPLVIWLDEKDGKHYILAGHHRYESKKRLKHKTTPVKIANSDYPTEEEAIRYARELSNANRTLETPMERAKIYRKLIKKGISKKELEKRAEIEGRNRSYILNLAHLSERGKTINALNQVYGSSDKQSSNQIEKISDWIGQVRRQYDVLTNAHENEMYDFLTDKSASRRITRKADFVQRISSITNDLYFNVSDSLNLKRFKYKSQGEEQYEKEYSELQNSINSKLDDIQHIKNRFTNPNNTDFVDPNDKDYKKMKKTADERISNLNSEIKNLQKKLIELSRKKGKYTVASNQAALFGEKKTKRKALSGVHNILEESVNESEFFTIPGAVGEFLQQVEKKPVHSVVVTLDGPQGAGKTTTIYRFINSFASAKKPCVFFSLEEHPQSHLARKKAAEYIDAENIPFVDSVGDLDSKEQFYEIVDLYDFIFIDSWQKLIREIGNIRLDEDLRKRFDGKVFVIIFQQTTTGRTKGGAEIVFDGDIIIKMVKESRFADNYAYMDKNRYTLRAIDELRYNIAGDYTYSTLQEEEKELEYDFEIE